MPAAWLNSEGFVIVFQEQIVENNGKKSYTEHSNPIQAYPAEKYWELEEIPEGAKQNGFADIGVRATLLHDLSEEDDNEDADGNDERALQAQADAAPGQAAETAKQAAEMVKTGDFQTPAEKQADLGKNLSVEDQVAAQVSASEKSTDTGGETSKEVKVEVTGKTVATKPADKKK